MQFSPQPDVRIPIEIQRADELQAHIATQLRELSNAQRDLSTRVAQMSEDNPARAEMVGELAEINAQLQALSHLATQPIGQGVTVIETPPPSFREFPHMPDEYLVIGLALIASTILPFSVAMAMRILRRGARPAAAAAQELTDRINRIESVVEATALEVERIGEGQRFVTQMMGEHMAVLREATRASLVEHGPNRAVSRQATPH